jgi:hypothetical protein
LTRRERTPPARGRPSRGLDKLAARAKEAREHADAARGKARADLEQDVKTARASAQAQADKLRESAEANKGKISVWWNDVERSWPEHIAKAREDIDRKRAEHSADKAERIAQNAEEDAAFAVDYAYAAIEEAEYAVLDAVLARSSPPRSNAGTSSWRRRPHRSSAGSASRKRWNCVLLYAAYEPAKLERAALRGSVATSTGARCRC